MRWLTKQWYSPHGMFGYAFSPLAGLYRGIIAIRQHLYQSNIKKISRFPIPVIVIGNITLGGTGKTPLVAWLANWLTEQGKKPGLVSRGYGGKAATWPQVVSENSDPRLVGEEAVMLVQQTHCPMVAGPDRVAAVNRLLANYDCDVVISDDGLQHYALGRDIEIAVIDGMRRFGNGFCLPAGPLREPKRRLCTVDFVITNGSAKKNEYTMRVSAGNICQVMDNHRILDLTTCHGKIIHAVAAIGHPQRFFQQLQSLGLPFIPHEFPDHHFYQPADIDFGENAIVIMTEKDAVKCRKFADTRHWYLPIVVEVDEIFQYIFREKFSHQ